MVEPVWLKFGFIIFHLSKAFFSSANREYNQQINNFQCFTIEFSKAITMKNILIAAAFFFSLEALAIPFTLRNNSLKSIPLEIPGVMDPNLSPMSNSMVDLCVGQEIFFDYNGERTLLLTVTEDLKNQKLNVSRLISQRKKELRSKQN
jgi:hypothetical protein